MQGGNIVGCSTYGIPDLCFRRNGVTGAAIGPGVGAGGMVSLTYTWTKRHCYWFGKWQDCRVMM